MQNRCQRLAELCVVVRSGSRDVEDARHLFMFQYKEKRQRGIMQVDPGKRLLSVSERSAQAQPERRQHTGQDTSCRGQHNPQARGYMAYPMVHKVLGRGFPVHTDRSQKIIARRQCFR